MLGSLGRLFGGAAKSASKVAGPASKAAAAAKEGGFLTKAKKFMGSEFGQAVLWAAGPSLVMGLFDGFSKKA
jgi:hypothetical protein